jgi:hypothetical protein
MPGFLRSATMGRAIFRSSDWRCNDDPEWPLTLPCGQFDRRSIEARAKMTSITAGLLVAACIFSGGVAGLYLHRVVPIGHLTRETYDVVKLGAGMLSVLASLVLGLLISTAKTSYDSADHAVQNYAAELALLNETLRDYGGTASGPRDLLRDYTRRFLTEGWPDDGKPSSIDNEDTRALLEHVRESIRALKPVDAGQSALQVEAVAINVALLRQRWLIIERQGPKVQRVVLVVLVSWVTIIFVSFGLSAPRNGTIVIAFLVCSLAIGAAIFLILELDRPLDGMMRISSWPVENVLAHMDWK